MILVLQMFVSFDNDLLPTNFLLNLFHRFTIYYLDILEFAFTLIESWHLDNFDSK